jgi:pimeloyl-ACP methyl ester carboxylesterase
MAFLEESSFDPTTPEAAAERRVERRWWGDHLAEMRWQAELARLLVDPVYHGRGVPRGDGSPVVTIPGFLAGDQSLSVMRGWLRRIGYRPHASGINFNVDCSDRAVERLDTLVERLHERSGRPVALVGHSRGGHFAKALARRRPDRIAAVISMGAGLDTPFDVSLPTKAGIAAFRALHAHTSDRIAKRGCFTDTCTCRFARDYAAEFPASVPLTSLYSRGDGVVWWEACVVPYARNVEVTGSHVGLAFNRKAYAEIAQALAASSEVG